MHRPRPGAILRALLCTLVPMCATAQAGHDLMLGRELAFTGAGLGTQGIGLALRLHNAKKPEPAIDLGRVPRIDRWATTQWHPNAHRASNALFLGAITASFAGAIAAQQGHRPLDGAVIAGEGFLLCAGITSIAKELVRRPRPYRFNPDVPAALHHPREDFVSFWSGHAANTAAITLSAAALIERSQARPELKTAAWIGAAATPVLMGYLRVRAGKHFITDVLAGAVVGTAVGLAVPYFHRRENANDQP